MMKHHEYQHQTTLDRLKHSTTARVAAGILVGILAGGCGTAGSGSSSQAGRTGSASPVAVGARTPGTTPPERASSAPSTPDTTPATQAAGWCSAAARVISTAFQTPVPESGCIMLPQPLSRGQAFMEFEGLPGGYTLQVTEYPFSFHDMSSGAQVVSAGSGSDEVNVALNPNQNEVYVDIGNGQTGGLQVETGTGGFIPGGMMTMLIQASVVFPEVFKGADPYGNAPAPSAG